MNKPLNYSSPTPLQTRELRYRALNKSAVYSSPHFEWITRTYVVLRSNIMRPEAQAKELASTHGSVAEGLPSPSEPQSLTRTGWKPVLRQQLPPIDWMFDNTFCSERFLAISYPAGL